MEPEPEPKIKEKFKKTKKPPQYISGDVYTNKLYSATINVSCKVIAPNNSIGFKPFDLYFQF